MSVAGIVLGVLLALGVGAFVGYPLFRRGTGVVGGEVAGAQDDTDRAIETEVAMRRANRLARARENPACPRCGAPGRAGDRFCSECGAALVGEGRK